MRSAVGNCSELLGRMLLRPWIPAFGDLCVIPVAGDSVAEIRRFPSWVAQPWIPAFAGMTRLTMHVGDGFPPSRE